MGQTYVAIAIYGKEGRKMFTVGDVVTYIQLTWKPYWKINIGHV